MEEVDFDYQGLGWFYQYVQLVGYLFNINRLFTCQLKITKNW